MTHALMVQLMFAGEENEGQKLMHVGGPLTLNVPSGCVSA